MRNGGTDRKVVFINAGCFWSLVDPRDEESFLNNHVIVQEEKT